MSKLKLWDAHASWEEASQAWDSRSEEAAKIKPLKGLKQLPNMEGITAETARHLKWKSFKWMITQDHTKEVLRGFLRHPIKYGWQFLKSIFRKSSYLREGDFFLYGVNSISEFNQLLKQEQTLLVVGFSYCHKPFECPSGRFTPDCIHELSNPVCQQCFIGKVMHALPNQETVPLIIPTIHYIGARIFELLHKNPKKRLIFIITACEMTLKMFGDWGNMTKIKGIGVRLDGRICNTMKAFELSEKGIKPGLTVVLEKTQEQILTLIRCRREAESDKCL